MELSKYKDYINYDEICLKEYVDCTHLHTG